MKISRFEAKKNKIQSYPTPKGKFAILSCNMRLLLNPLSASHPGNNCCVFMLVVSEHL